jgi:hypothetical protein
MPTRLRSLAVLVPLALVAIACSGNDGSDVSAAGSGGDLRSIAGSLALLPDVGDESVERILWGDLARADEVAQLTRPDDVSNLEAVMDYRETVTGRAISDVGPRAYLQPPEAAAGRRSIHPTIQEFADDVGWSLLDVDRFVERQFPLEGIAVLEGSFDESALTEANGEPEDGTWVLGSGESSDTNVLEPTPARRLGESLWLRLDGDRLSVTNTEEHSSAVERALAGESDTPTVARDEVLSGLADVLDSASPYAAALLRYRQDRSGERVAPEGPGEPCGTALPEATTAVGTAIADDGGPVILVALAHDSAAAARANAEGFERIATEGASRVTDQPWNELLALEDVTVTGDERVVLGRLRPTEDRHGSIWFDMTESAEALVTSC